MAERVPPQQERAAPEAAAPDGAQEAPPAPTALPRGSWRAAAKRTLAEYQEDNLQDRAAALTYFSVQSIFPGLLVLVTLLGLLGTSVTQNLIDQLTKTVPGSVSTIVSHALHRLQHSHSAAGILAVAGLALGLWSASAYVAAFMRAANVIYDVPEGRPAWITIPVRLAVTVAMLVLLVFSVVIVVVTGGVARRAGRRARARLGRGDRVGHRQVAGAGDHRQHHARDPVLGQPERPARLPLGQPRRAARGAAVAGRLRPVRAVRGLLRELQQGLRQLSAGSSSS